MEPIVSGIYAITNTKTGRIYIGSSWDVVTRLKAHRAALRGGRHHNYPLQLDWDDFGEDAFTMQLIEETSSAEADLAEAEIRQVAARTNLYNIRPVFRASWLADVSS